MNENALAYGVDVGGTTIKLGLFDGRGSLLCRGSIPTDTSDRGAHILPQISKWIRRQDVPLNQISGVGLGVPGPVRRDGTVNRCVNLGWGVVPVAEVLSELLDGVPVRVANDANAAALGECWQGAGREMDSLLLVTLGTGVGGGLVLHGDVVAGAHGSAGEIGHMTVNPDETRLCSCGKRGCLEQYASAGGIVRLAREAGLLVESAKDVSDLAVWGNERARAVLEKAGRLLGLALSYAACLVDVDGILLGGGVAAAGEWLLNPVRDAFAANVFHAASDTKLALASLGNDAGLYGAARLVWNGQSDTTSL